MSLAMMLRGMVNSSLTFTTYPCDGEVIVVGIEQA